MDPKNKKFIALLKVSGWSQAEAARRLEITPGAVSQICHGRTRPGTRTLRLFEIILGRRKSQALQPSENPSFSKDELELVGIFRKFSENKRQRFLTIIRAFVPQMSVT
jgi:transcriptional regulator with XRE-family HTH domain